MLDVLSNGRLDLGAGRGATLQEMSAMGRRPGAHLPRGRRGAAHDRLDVARSRRGQLRVARRAARGRRAHDPAPAGPAAPPAPVPGLHQERHGGARRRVRHRGAGARLLGPRRRRRAQPALPGHDRDPIQEAVRVTPGQRPLLGVVPDRRPRRRRRRPPDRRARAAVLRRGDRPLVRRWTAAPGRGPRHRPGGRDRRGPGADGRAPPRGADPGAARTAATPSTWSSTPTGRGATRSRTPSGSRRPARTRSCASSRWAPCPRRPAWRPSASGASTSSRTSERSAPRSPERPGPGGGRVSARRGPARRAAPPR